MIKALATAALASVAAIPLVLGGGAWAQPSPGDQAQAEAPRDPGRPDWKRGDGPDHRGHDQHGRNHGGPERHGPRHGGDRGGPRGPFALAERLSNLEVILGIKSAQLDVWRDYTSAFLALTEPPQRPDFGPGPGSGPQPAPQPDGETPPQPGQQPAVREARLPGEGLADRIIGRADKARTFQQAAEALRGALAPDQLEKLTRLESEMMRGSPGGHDRGPHGHQRRGTWPQPGFERPADLEDGPEAAAPDEAAVDQQAPEAAQPEE